MEDMTLLIALVSCAIAVLTFIDRKDRRKTDNVSNNQKVLDKLDNINTMVTDIKNSVHDIKQDIKDHSERITRLEEWRKMKEGEH